jgi:tetratricopeptide (TPR) repeat protein
MANEPKNDFGYGDQFEPDVFWQAHGRKIIWALVGLVVLVVAGYYWQSTTREAQALMAARFADAETADALEDFIADYGNKPTGAIALLKLGSVRFDSGRFDEAEQAYKRFIQGFPQHALIPQARYALAVIAESRGQHGEASQLYQNFAQQYGTSPLMPATRVGLARCAETLGQTEQAIQLYQDAMAAASGAPTQQSFWGEIASSRHAILTRDKPKVAPTTKDASPENAKEPAPTTAPAGP